MSAPTPTERIATALLGWAKTKRGSYMKEATEVRVNPDGTLEDSHTPPHMGKWTHSWPDLRSLDDCRRFEDALVTEKLLGTYRLALLAIYDVNEIHQGSSWACWVMLRSTAEQRVAACLRVLDEVKL